MKIKKPDIWVKTPEGMKSSDYKVVFTGNTSVGFTYPIDLSEVQIVSKNRQSLDVIEPIIDALRSVERIELKIGERKVWLEFK